MFCTCFPPTWLLSKDYFTGTLLYRGWIGNSVSATHPPLPSQRNRKEKLFSPRHRRPQWLQMTRLYSFHCEPIIAVMLISLFNYPPGSHGRAVIKRKAAKMNGVIRVSQLNTVTSALWEIENTCEFWGQFTWDQYFIWEAFANRIQDYFRLSPNFLLKTKQKKNHQYGLTRQNPRSTLMLFISIKFDTHFS